MKLRDLEAKLLKGEYTHEQAPGVGHSTQPPYKQWRYVERVVDADGLDFLCPACFKTNNGPVGTHKVMVAFTNSEPLFYPMRNAQGIEPRWTVAGGATIDDLSLTPSIQLLGGCNWHGFVGSNGVPAGEAA